MSNQLKTLLVALLALVILQSCENNKKETASGLAYTLVKEGEGEPIEDGQFLLMNMQYKDETDSVWMNTDENGMPVVVPKNDSLWNRSEGSIEQIFAELKKGDSVTFTLSTKDFFENTVKGEMPPNVSKEGALTFYVGVENVLNKEEYQTWQQEMMMKQQEKQMAAAEKQMTDDIAAIEDYLNEQGIKAQKAESGLFYVIKEEGTGQQAAAGDSVGINYVGKVLNGPYVDTNIKEVAEEHGLYSEQRDQQGGYDGPYTFALGQGRVIKGWDQGIPLLKEGAEATLYIPSPLAYGPQAMSKEIEANSIIVFDLELVEVKKNEE